MKFHLKSILLVCIFSALSCYGIAQNTFLEDAPENTFNSTVQKRVIIPARYRTLRLNMAGLLNFLNTIPSEKKIVLRNTSPVIEIPMPGGGSARFHIWESPVMGPGLAAKFPGIKTFTGQGIDDPTANIKLDITRFGLHAMIISSLNGAVFIDPYSQGNTLEYISYNKIDFTKAGKFTELPPLELTGNLSRPASPSNVLAGLCIGTELRTYRLALAADGEYTAFHGGTVAGAIAAEATTMNRVNGVYERELAIRMILVDSNDLVVYTNSATDPYTNDNAGNIMLTQNQSNIDLVIGTANYDIGHVFSTGGGGVAARGSVCIEGNKARGVTGTNSPVGDPFDIDYVAHEMGHQFGASHPFNSELAGTACAGNSVKTTNAEPGSGSTIMAYAGICGSDNLQNNSDAQFHAVSLNEISLNTITGNGNSCAMVTATGNTPPVVNAGSDFVIPKSTPFVLSGSGTDPNGDPLTFSWEEIDVGGPFGTWNHPLGNAPIFRSFVPVATPVRYFPKLSDVLTNTTSKGELMPSYARTLNFRLTARDNKAGGGGVCFDETAITVSETAGPFQVTFPNAVGITWLVNDFKNITWNPAGTAAAPINCTNVRIELSTDGGLTFPFTLLANTPNDGLEEIQVPGNITSSARIRIMAVGNVFYDISNANFSIQNSPTPDFTFNSPLPVVICGGNNGVANLKTASLTGFLNPVNLSATGLPGVTTVTFGTNPLTPGNNTTVTLSNTGALASGTYDITVNGVAGTVNKTRVISFIIPSNPDAPSNLSAPANNSIGIAALPSFNWTAVSGASFYTLEISTSNTFAPIIQTVTNITSLPKSLTTPLAENTVYYWRVTTTNNCLTGPASATGIFRTGITPCKNSTDVPKLISASGTPTVTSALIIPGISGAAITDLNVVGLTGTHSFISDITVTLTSPVGTSVILFDKICSSNKNFNINLDDEATLVTIPCPPTGNQTARPQNPLSAFDGQGSTGKWTLTVKDNISSDGGSLTGWGLVINNCTFIATPLVSAPWTQLCPSASSPSLTSNLTGTTYQWQVNMGGGLFVKVNNNANYSGANTGTLQINNALTSWNGYQYRCVVDGINSSVFTLGFTSYWNGTVNNAWENAANWSCNAVPDEFTDVIINGATVLVNSNANCRSIKVSSGSSVNVNTGFKFIVAH
ncbi:MAG: reprolysin-like metallopeptidase [Ferruginibacter sp.]